jgi:peptide/nickel transport system permease protein
MGVKRYLCSLVSRIFGLSLVVFVLIAVVPGDSRSFLAGAFEAAGLDLGARNINPWTLEYMSFHFGESWLSQVFSAFVRTFFLATLSALLSIFMFLCFYFFLSRKTASWLDLSSGFFLSMVSVLISPVVAIVYLRLSGNLDQGLLAYGLAAFSISFVSLGTYMKFTLSKYSQLEYRDLAFGLTARGIGEHQAKWIHVLKLLAPDFLVLFFSRYAAHLSGVFVAEMVFNIRGLGWYFSQAFQSRSGLLMLILVLLSSLLYLLLNHFALYAASRLDTRRLYER